MTNAKKIIDDLLTDLPRGTRNVIEDNEPLAEAVQHFMQLKRDGDERVKGITLRWFYLNKLRDRFDGPRWHGTVRKYVIEVLKMDPSTGKAL